MTEPGTLPDCASCKQAPVREADRLYCEPCAQRIAGEMYRLQHGLPQYPVSAGHSPDTPDTDALPDVVERLIARYRLERVLTDWRTGDVSLCALSLSQYESDLRAVSRLAFAEGICRTNGEVP